MKLDYDSLPTLMLVAAGLFVMFASPPTVNYDEVESAGKRLGNENLRILSSFNNFFVFQKN